MTFRGIDPLQGNQVQVVDLTIAPLGDITLDLTDIPWRDGARLARQGRGAKQIDLTFVTLNDRMEELPGILDKLNAWAYGGLGELRLYGDEERAYEAVLSGVSTVSYGIGAQATYTFVAPSGLKYGPERSRRLTGDPIWVGGNAPTGFVLTHTLPEAAKEVLWSNGAQQLRLTGDFAAGSRFVVDSDREQVTLGGQNAMRFLTLDSRFFPLVPGSNAIQGAGEVTYKEAWL
jgi:phage-related protein